MQTARERLHRMKMRNHKTFPRGNCRVFLKVYEMCSMLWAGMKWGRRGSGGGGNTIRLCHHQTNSTSWLLSSEHDNKNAHAPSVNNRSPVSLTLSLSSSLPLCVGCVCVCAKCICRCLIIHPSCCHRQHVEMTMRPACY